MSPKMQDEDTDQSQKAAFKDAFPIGVFPIHPPREVHQQLLKDSFKKVKIGPTVHLPFDLECPEHRPRVPITP